MNADVEFTLVHDGRQWVCRNDAITVNGESLAELDEELGRALRESGEYPPGSRLTVFMGFDFDTIPTWLRQYHDHYFNRLVSINL
ncbi:MAG TPA: hypothetical protein ENK54_05445 [Thiotrichales bacterium]|nr:hypothetical protein [Thiotrichales bacterium]